MNIKNNRKIRSFDYPYRYLIKEDFFTNNIIEYISKNNENFYNASDKASKVLNNKKLSNKRNIIRLIEKNKVKLNKNKKINKFSKILQKFLKKKINTGFYRNLKLKENLRKKGFLNVTLCWDKPGYSMRPHTDTTRKIWTGLIYLFGNGNGVGGTTMLVKDTRKKLKKFKRINPKINRLFAFKRTNISYHCVEKSNANRIMIMLNYNYKNRYFNEI